MRLRVLSTVFAFVFLFAFCSVVSAGNLYFDTAGTPNLGTVDPATGAVTDQFTPASAASGNGRGAVVVGDLFYYTLANSGNVYAANRVTHADLGVQFSVAGATGLSTMAFDVTNFWIGDYSGTNKAYHYTPTGALLGTITLSNCTEFCDGLEYFLDPVSGAPRLISNEFDGGFGGTNTYDVYDTSGNLITPGFIKTTQAPAATGIAYDGTNFWVAGIGDSAFYEYSGTTGAFIQRLPITGGTHGTAFEDLSADYAVVLPPSSVPEPATCALIAGGLACLAVMKRRRARPSRERRG
jgi:hypothetical protein